MGFWFFLTAVVATNMMLKAYKLRLVSKNDQGDHRIKALELELKNMKEKISHLEETVFLGDFELKRQFHKLEQDAKRY
jgi:hypothetical protein